MAVTIRMARYGRKKIPFYRVVAAHSEACRDGRFIELLGTVNPLENPAAVKLKEDRVKYWISVGAQPSDTVSQIIEKVMPGHLTGIVEQRKSKIRAQRAKRKASSKTTATAPKKAAKKAAAKK